MRLLRAVELVLAPRYPVQGWSAGAMSLPPLSPLVAPSACEYR
jgi:hypothetical protein